MSMTTSQTNQITGQATQDTPVRRGLTVSVLRPVDFPDCTNGGASARVAKLTVIGIIDEVAWWDAGNRGDRNPPVQPLPADCQVSTPSDDAPAAYLRRRRIGRIVHSVEPVYTDRATQPWLMAGGNYAASSDSRWADLIGMYGAVSIHDRNEER